MAPQVKFLNADVSLRWQCRDPEERFTGVLQKRSTSNCQACITVGDESRMNVNVLLICCRRDFIAAISVFFLLMRRRAALLKKLP